MFRRADALDSWAEAGESVDLLVAGGQHDDGDARSGTDAAADVEPVDAGEILLRWCIDQGVVPVTTSAKEQRMSDYLRAITFKLTPVEVDEISKAGNEHHYRAFWTHKFEADDRT